LRLNWLVALGAIFYVQIYRYRRLSSPSEQQQTKWIIYRAAVGIVHVTAACPTVYDTEQSSLTKTAGDPLSCEQVHGEVCSRMRLQCLGGSPPRSEAFACVLPAKLHDEGPKL
jgi:hypothetical protein